MEAGKYVRHIRVTEPFVVKCDGENSQGVIVENN